MRSDFSLNSTLSTVQTGCRCFEHVPLLYFVYFVSCTTKNRPSIISRIGASVFCFRIKVLVEIVTEFRYLLTLIVLYLVQSKCSELSVRNVPVHQRGEKTTSGVSINVCVWSQI